MPSVHYYTQKLFGKDFDEVGLGACTVEEPALPAPAPLGVPWPATQAPGTTAAYASDEGLTWRANDVLCAQGQRGAALWQQHRTGKGHGRRWHVTPMAAGRSLRLQRDVVPYRVYSMHARTHCTPYTTKCTPHNFF